MGLYKLGKCTSHLSSAHVDDSGPTLNQGMCMYVIW